MCLFFLSGVISEIVRHFYHISFGMKLGSLVLNINSKYCVKYTINRIICFTRVGEARKAISICLHMYILV